VDPNPVELFLHISGVIGMFIGYGALVLGTIALRRATRLEDVRAIANAMTYGRRVGFEHVSVIDALVVASILVIAGTGLDLARYTGDLRSGWVEVAIATFLVMAPLGPFVINPRLHAVARAASDEGVAEVPAQLHKLVHDPVLTISLRGSLAVLVGLVFVMTVKPSLLWSAVVVLLAALVGFASAAIGLRRSNND
jgi:hypothetical protein